MVLLILLGSSSCQNEKQDQQKHLIEYYIQSYNKFDVKGMLHDLSETVVFENSTNGQVDLTTNGIEEFKAQAETALQYFSQRKQTITSWDFQDDKVIIGIDYEGILAIDLPNGLKTGDTLKLQGQSEFIFKDGKIISIKDKS